MAIYLLLGNGLIPTVHGFRTSVASRLTFQRQAFVSSSEDFNRRTERCNAKVKQVKSLLSAGGDAALFNMFFYEDTKAEMNAKSAAKDCENVADLAKEDLKYQKEMAPQETKERNEFAMKRELLDKSFELVVL